jgi:amidohydrolase
MPELSFKEHKTAARIKDWLESQGVANVTTVTETGVVALIEGAQPGRTIMYRADIDALPVEEDSGVDYSSDHPGVMHACGHDAHTAIALMLTSMLNARRENIQGSVKIVFQPAEEVGGGAEPPIDAGVLENPH